jgi:hypothetical protein
MLSPMNALDRWTDPVVLTGVAVMAAAFAVTFVAVYYAHGLVERLDQRVPTYRRPLVAAYARFHAFLLGVQLAAIRRVQGAQR